jgi:chromosome partitioning protein
VQTITFSNNKGGSGKTTTTVSLAGAFAERGLRVLVIDLDPQGSTSEWLGGPAASPGLVRFSAGGIPLSRLIIETEHAIDLIPAGPDLVPSGERSENDTGLALIRAFRRLPDYWDLVLVDTPPTLGYLSLAPLVACDQVVIPVEAHALALPGVASVVASIQRARRQLNPELGLLGIVPCRVTATTHTRDVVARLRAEYGDVVLDHVIRESIRVAEAPALRLPVTRFAPASRVAVDYRAVADELLGRIGDLAS